MKKVITLYFVFLAAHVQAQPNEFAVKSFYDSLNKIIADAKAGFVKNKGKAVDKGLGDIIKTYKAKLKLPGTDSANVNFPIYGKKNVTYFFKPGTTLAAAQEKAKQVVQALSNATNATLYPKVDNTTIKGISFYRIAYSYDAKNTLEMAADFQTTIYEEKGKYMVLLEIRGDYNNATPPEVKTSKLKTETDLQGKLNTFYTQAQSYFAGMKGAVKNADQYFTNYTTSIQLFGLDGKIEDGKYTSTLRYSFSFIELLDINEAEQIYSQLKAGLISAYAGKIVFDAETKSAYDTDSYSISGKDAGANSISTKHRINLSIKRDAKYPAVYLSIERAKR